MQQIHHIHIGYQERWVTDPNLGLVKRREEVVKTSTVHQLTWEGETYDIDPDLSFTVPDDVADFFLSRPATGWKPGPNPLFVEDNEVAPEVEFATATRSRSRKK